MFCDKTRIMMKAIPWVWWDAGMGPLIYTGLTVTGQTRERRRQGCEFHREGTAGGNQKMSSYDVQNDGDKAMR